MNSANRRSGRVRSQMALNLKQIKRHAKEFGTMSAGMTFSLQPATRHKIALATQRLSIKKTARALGDEFDSY
jgi:hypothetical protein